MRTFSTIAAAATAAFGVKWMSATIGTPDPLGVEPSADFAEVLGVAEGGGGEPHQRASRRDQRAAISATTASVSRVSEVVIDWTTMAWSPPMVSRPTRTPRVRRRRGWSGSLRTGESDMGALPRFVEDGLFRSKFRRCRFLQYRSNGKGIATGREGGAQAG